MIDFIDDHKHIERNLHDLDFVSWRAAIPCIIFIFSIFIYIFDQGPAVPPFSSETNSIDCRYLSYYNYTLHDGVADFYFNLTETLNFPPEYIPHFISLYTINNENVAMEFEKKDLKNMSLINGTIKFTLQYPISGQLFVRFDCLKKEFATQKLTLVDINDTDDETFSTKGFSGIDLVRMKNVCFEKKKFLFFSHQAGYSKSIPFNQTQIPFEIIHWQLPFYLHSKNVSRTNITSFLLPPFDLVPWKSLLFNLFPIASSIEANNETDSKNLLFYFKETPVKNTIEILKRLSVKPASKILKIQCFKSIVFPSSYSHFTPSAVDVETALSRNFTFLRTAFPKTTIQKKKVVVSSTVSKLLVPIMKEICSDCTIQTISAKSDVMKFADQVASAEIFIGNHLYHLFHMVWLTPNQSTLIDVSPSNYSCIKYPEIFCGIHNLSYYRVNPLSKECTSFNFDSYPPIAVSTDSMDFNEDPDLSPENLQKILDIDIESFKTIFRDALTKTRYAGHVQNETPHPTPILLPQGYFPDF